MNFAKTSLVDEQWMRSRPVLCCNRSSSVLMFQPDAKSMLHAMSTCDKFDGKEREASVLPGKWDCSDCHTKIRVIGMFQQIGDGRTDTLIHRGARAHPFT